MRAASNRAGYYSTILPIAIGVTLGILLLFVKPLYLLVCAGGMALSVLVIRKPSTGLYFVAATIPLETVGRIGSLTPNLPLTIPKILTLVTLVSCMIHISIGKMRFRRLPWMYFLIMFLVAAGLSLIGASEVRSGFEALLRFFTTVVFFFLVVQLVDSTEVLKKILIVFLVACSAASSYSLIQRYIPGQSFDFRFGWEENSARKGGVEKDIVERKMVGVVNRSSGFSPHSILLALNISLLLGPIAAFMGNSSKRGIFSLLFWVMILAILVASTLVTFARTGFIIVLLGVVLMIWTGLIRFSIGKLVAAFFLMLLLAMFLPQKYADRVLNLNAYSTTSASVQIRLKVVDAAFRQFLDHPILGVGYGNRYGIFKYFPSYQDKKHAITPHNAYVQVASQVGIIGLIPLIGFFWKMVRHTHRSTKIFRNLGQEDMVRLGKGLNISLMIFLFSGLAVDLFDKGMAHSWMIIGLCGAYILLGDDQALNSSGVLVGGYR